MALARIITRSQACSRALALDLLARGYAVEIVSPDRIPDNIADLELRVDAGSGDQLIATVETRDGERSASLEFVHHLKAPMVDFIRRPIQSAEAVQPVVNFNAEPSLGDMEQLVEAPTAASRAVSPPAEILHERPNLKASTRPTSPPVQPAVPIKPPNHSVIASSTVSAPTIVSSTIVSSTNQQPMRLLPKAQVRLRVRPAAWFWRAAVAFASVVLLASVFWFGMRLSDKASTQPSGQVSRPVLAEKVAADVKPEGTANHASTEAQAAKLSAAAAGNSAAKVPLRTSTKRDDGLIARDTVTYLDTRAADQAAARTKPSTKHFAARHSASSKQRSGVIAANSVTYFDYKPVPKSAKPESAAKSGSAPN